MTRDPEREQRLAAALRENLKRRKARERAALEPNQDDGDEAEPAQGSSRLAR